MLGHLDAGTTDRAAGVMRNPVGIYTDPGRFEAEMARILRRKTLLACLSGRLPGPGSYLAEDLAGVPVLLMRGEDGVARAFLNSCRHRGTRLLDGAGAVRRAFACPYHGWTYGPDGQLTGVPDREAFDGVDLADCTLAALPCAEADGLIWIRLSGESPADPGESLDGLTAEFAGYGLAGYHHYDSHRMTPAINWKMALDTFMEPYHFAVLHKQTVAPIFFPNLCLYDEFGESFREYLPRRSIEENARAAGGGMGRGLAFRDRLLPAAQRGLRHAAGPCRGVAHLPARRPGSTGPKSISTCTSPSRRTSDKARRHWDANLDLAVRTVENEDFAAAESAYAGFARGLADEVVYGRNEPALQGLHRRLAAMMAGQ